MFSWLLAASLSFTASATGVQKGTAVEFAFAGLGSDRDYETMFLLDEPVDAFCTRLEKAGLPRGTPVDVSRSVLWPVGCKLTFDPPLSKYIAGKMPEGLPSAEPIYTGGLRLPNGSCDAGTNMPLSVFSIFTLAQSPIVFDGIYNQGAVYGAFTAAEQIKKGSKVKFTVSWRENSMPQALSVTARPGQSVALFRQLRAAATNADLVVQLGFDSALTVKESIAIANAAATLDSNHVKFNGSPDFFYRSFLPLVKWRDRKERLIQPFELSVGDADELLRIEEDWTVEGCDPKLTPVSISFADAPKYPKTDTCFVYATEDTRLERIRQALDRLPDSARKNIYVFVK